MTEFEESITLLYDSMRAGDRVAEQRLFDLIYPELLRRARHFLTREKRSPTITARGLVHEAYTRLVVNLPRVEDRHHLLNLLTEVMRHVWIDWARSRRAHRRNAAILPLDTENLRKADAFQHRNEYPLSPVTILAVDEGLSRLAKRNPIAAKLVELYYFGGCTIDEAAHQLGLSKSDAGRKLKTAIGKLGDILDSAPSA